MSWSVVDLSRHEVAMLLRAARMARDDDAARLMEWVLLVAPECRAAQRIKIAGLIADGDFEHADAMLARALLIRPFDASFMLLRARSLCAQRRFVEADRELNRLLAIRPDSRRALRASAETAERLDEPARAAELFGRLTRMAPDDSEAQQRRISALIDAGDLEQAEELLEAMPQPPCMLTARLRRRQGRLLDAVGLLHAEIAQGDREVDPGTILLLLELLEDVGEFRGAQRLAGSFEEEHPVVRLRSALLLLRQGRFAQAACEMARLRADAALADDALRTLAVAAALGGRPRLSRRAMARLRARGAPVSPREMIERWRRGMIGRFVLHQRSAKTAGADPCSSLLRPLISRALATFEAIARGEEDAPIEASELRRHRTACIEALGGGSGRMPKAI